MTTGSTLPTLKTVQAVRTQISQWRAAGEAVGFVPTMGYLHEGHLSLVRAAKARAGRVLVSIFVNPTQFNDPADLERYPRDVARDQALLLEAGANAVFLPDVTEIYPEGSQTFVDVTGLSAEFEGRHRPGHFRGVTTVVSALFHIVQADFAVFGEKDFQQLRIIEQMVRDLHFPIEIVRGKIVREPDGLAMSSRNVLLSVEDRRRALGLSRGLFDAKGRFTEGERSASTLCETVRAALEEGVVLEYVAVIEEDSLRAVEQVPDQGGRIVLAAKVGAVRLIDNIEL